MGSAVEVPPNTDPVRKRLVMDKKMRSVLNMLPPLRKMIWKDSRYQNIWVKATSWVFNPN
jgi:hypothetical protein